MKNGSLIAIILVLWGIPPGAAARELVNLVPEGNFDSADALGGASWRSFSTGVPAVSVSGGRLKGVRSPAGGLAALSRDFAQPQQRLLIEFSFAYFSPGDGRGRSLNLWTHEPDGVDASQFNLCIQGGNRLMQYDGRTKTWETISSKVMPSTDPDKPVWHRLRVVIDADAAGADYWLSPPGTTTLPDELTATMAVYRTKLPIGGIDFVSGTRIASGAWYLIDDLVVRGGRDVVPAPRDPAALPEPYELWSGGAVPRDPDAIPFVEGIEHRTIHRPGAGDHKFLHGAAILEHEGVFYANWANSPLNENQRHETLRGKRSRDGGKTWGPLEIIAPGFAGEDRHSHGILFVHQDRVWTICARFGAGDPGRHFRGLQGEAFVLNPETDRWESRGIVMNNCWPYDQPVRMGNGNFITGGQDKDGLSVVAISHGDNFTRWDSILLPHPPQLKPAYAETTVWAEGARVLAVIRGGGGRAWVATSDDHGRTWTRAQPSNLPMPRAKAYLGRLSTGQLYLLSNHLPEFDPGETGVRWLPRDTLVISTGKPGAWTVNKMWRIRHGKSEAPHFKGAAKSKQWSYPYGYEHDGKLFVVYSVGKEECGLSVLPVGNLR